MISLSLYLQWLIDIFTIFTYSVGSEVTIKKFEQLGFGFLIKGLKFIPFFNTVYSINSIVW